MKSYKNGKIRFNGKRIKEYKCQKNNYPRWKKEEKKILMEQLIQLIFQINYMKYQCKILMNGLQ